MKDLETLLSLVVGLVYFIVSVMRKAKTTSIPEPEGETVWPMPAATDQQEQAIIPNPLLAKDALPQAQPQPIASSFKARDRHGAANSSPKKLRGSSTPSSAHQLARVLGRYSNLKRGVIMSELLQPKSFHW